MYFLFSLILFHQVIFDISFARAVLFQLYTRDTLVDNIC